MTDSRNGSSGSTRAFHERVRVELGDSAGAMFAAFGSAASIAENLRFPDALVKPLVAIFGAISIPIPDLEWFKRCCNHSWRKGWEAVFLGFGVLSASIFAKAATPGRQLRGFQRCVLAPRRHYFFKTVRVRKVQKADMARLFSVSVASAAARSESITTTP